MYIEKDKNELAQLFVDNILETNRSFDVYVDWTNATKKNFEQFDIELNAMNCLIKKKVLTKFFTTINSKILILKELKRLNLHSS